MRRKLFPILICLSVLVALVSCGTEKNGKDAEAKPVVSITEEVADESLPLPTDEAEQTVDLPGTNQTEPVKAEQTQEQHDADTENTAEAYKAPEETVRVEDDTLTCTLFVRCDTVFDNVSKLPKEKLAILPRDGIIFPKTKVVFYAGESVFNVLTRELKKNRIHIDFVTTPMYNTVYIKGISNLYEQDCGELSGWVYMVNGKVPSYGCSQYMLKDGDDIAFVYTCDLGKDVH